MSSDLDRLAAQLPDGWSYNATRKGGGPRVYSAYKAREGLQTRRSTRIEDVVMWAHRKEKTGGAKPGEQMTLLDQRG